MCKLAGAHFYIPDHHQEPDRILPRRGYLLIRVKRRNPVGDAARQPSAAAYSKERFDRFGRIVAS